MNKQKTKFFSLIGIFLVIVVLGIFITKIVGQTPSEKSEEYLKIFRNYKCKNRNTNKNNFNIRRNVIKRRITRDFRV